MLAAGLAMTAPWTGSKLHEIQAGAWAISLGEGRHAALEFSSQTLVRGARNIWFISRLLSKLELAKGSALR